LKGERGVDFRLVLRPFSLATYWRKRQSKEDPVPSRSTIGKGKVREKLWLKRNNNHGLRERGTLTK